VTLILHLVKSLFGAFFKISFAAVLTGGALAGIALLVAYRNVPVWPPNTLTVAAVGAIGLLAAYGAGMTVLLREALRAALTVERGILKGVVQEVQDIEHQVTDGRR
jgi:hypothetical protein